MQNNRKAHWEAERYEMEATELSDSSLDGARHAQTFEKESCMLRMCISRYLRENHSQFLFMETTALTDRASRRVIY